ncbi:DNA repair protein complementing XP-C cells homolog [Euwallacea similis]|uniref:DNA repair protein complementing XP-C cells homolog n=1 Tax=Euwallacea similis TaxID=1736056 RepID=UPI003450B3B5
MKRRRGGLRNFIESSSSEDEKSSPKKSPPSQKLTTNGDLSSSESDIETYLQKPEKLDLNSTFFNSKAIADFEKIESNIFSGVTRLSDSESDTEQPSVNDALQDVRKASSVKFNNVYTHFDSFQKYTRQIEEAKKYVEKYNSKMTKVTENQADIFNLLSVGEGKFEEFKVTPADLHSSAFESCDSEQEGWEEIQNSVEKEKSLIPAEGLQVVVNLPENVKKKKGIDLLATMKRRLNRIRKENQILIHKVHLLCWIAHGNYVNSVINSTEILAAALSLMPSEQSFPSERIDLTYLEQIVAWFKKTQRNVDKSAPENIDLKQCLQDQMKNKEAYNKKMLALIFIAILRSFGVQTRLVLSLQVEPLRPPSTDLHYEGTSKAKDQKSKVKNVLGTPVKAGPSGVKINIEKATPVKKKKSSTGLKEENNKLKPSPVKQRRRTKSLESADAAKDDVKTRKLPEDMGQKCMKSTENLKKKTAKASDTIKKPSSGKVSQDNTDKKLPMSKPRKSSTNSVIEDTTSKNIEISHKKPQSSSTGSTQTDLKITESRIHSKSAESLQSKRSTRTSQTPTTIEKPSSKPKNHPNAKKIKTKTKKISKNIQQLDGLYSSDSNDETWLLQLDGANDKPTIKPNLKSLKSKTGTSIKAPTKRPEKRPNLRSLKVKKAVNVSDSDSEFEPYGGVTMKVRMDEAASQFKKHQEAKMIVTNKGDVKKDIMKLVKTSILTQSHSQRNSSRLASKRKSIQPNSDDSDYLPEPIKKKHHDSEDDFVPKTKVKRRVQVKPELQDNGEKKKKEGNDVWVEVFLESEEKWICVDVAFGQVHCIKEIMQRASHPITYVVAWDNNNNLKDVTQRYCPNFNTVTRKLRADGKWWIESLSPFKALPTARDREEDEDLSRQQMDQPLPKAISEYKNHPLYVLRRHLLKFEAIYPPEPSTLGFIRGEAVYPRSCVYTLHSRDIWLKQAKVVKMREEPYKIVKARPRWDKLSNQIVTDQLLEIFGPWQVEDYVPPTAENGVVPRNAFGNVDLFKSCMLPKGCVHLKLPGLNKVAKRLNIDCASAITGFDFHGGWSHPIYDGFVACEEFKDQLVAAWEKEQDELDKKEQEKIDKRVYGNWKRLIRGLLIRERLKIKYNFSQPSTSAPKSKKGKVVFCTKKK